jgi:predicted alpha/beta-hydrolase family hydrolase
VTLLPLTLTPASGGSLSALLDAPSSPSACYVFAHGAGAGMEHAFMAAIAGGLAQRGIATLRFQFPFMQQGSRRPDPPAVAQAAVRAAVQEMAGRFPGLPLFAGGKSFGGRMTSQAQAAEPMPGLRGIAFVGFPLHPAGTPATERARHLAQVQVPMLFLQGTRDALADLELIRSTVQALGARATLRILDGADHAFHVLARSGRTDEQVREELLDALAGWLLASPTPALPGG